MIRNFLFHRVNPVRDKLWDPMSPPLFEKCIKYITKKYKVVNLEQLVTSDLLNDTRTNFATIVFDDGYKDNIQYAAPILDKYHCNASFYVVTDCIENNTPTWTHLLEFFFQNTAVNKIDLSFDFLPEGLKTHEINSVNERISFVKKLKPFLKKVSHEQRNLVLKRCRDTYDDVQLPDLMMNWNDVKQLHVAGHYIGSHTVSHCMLGTMSDRKEIMYELEESRRMIKNNLDYLPLTISYPVGSYNENVKELSREAGYKIGLAVNQTIYDPLKYDTFEIPRIELYNESWIKTQLRITNLLEDIKKAIKYKRA